MFLTIGRYLKKPKKWKVPDSEMWLPVEAKSPTLAGNLIKKFDMEPWIPQSLIPPPSARFNVCSIVNKQRRKTVEPPDLI